MKLSESVKAILKEMAMGGFGMPDYIRHVAHIAHRPHRGRGWEEWYEVTGFRHGGGYRCRVGVRWEYFPTDWTRGFLVAVNCHEVKVAVTRNLAERLCREAESRLRFGEESAPSSSSSNFFGGRTCSSPLDEEEVFQLLMGGAEEKDGDLCWKDTDLYRNLVGGMISLTTGEQWGTLLHEPGRIPWTPQESWKNLAGR
ncbi:MAG: hypothetical protein PHS27_01840 [Candidatus Pacebacteria bacterium]|nr:hypothetical protein [Candidatus Paceibacterota bacterium]